ncbi:MAG TPA: gluconokinase [Rhodocyclaceae bacterium]|nr:gluconokinase [Rhodocyclaceae bacterium]
MGVAGCGKSSVAEACARRMGWHLVEGDDYHSPEASEKMRSGTPLTDADREGWLQRLGAVLQAHALPDQPGVVLTCSSLRRRYRDQLRAALPGQPGLRFAFLDLTMAQAQARVAARAGHLFPASLVASQFATLESPVGEPGVLRLDATEPISALAEQVGVWLSGGGKS